MSALEVDVVEKSEMILRQFRIETESPFLGKTIKESGIRNVHHCLIAGIEREDGTLHAPLPDEPLSEGDVVWVVGETEDIRHLADMPDEE